MPSAIVTGATGILGRQIVFELSKSPQQWPTVHALSRSQKEQYPSNVIHNHIDLSAAPEEMVKDLGNVQADYLFFAAYLQQDTEQENWDVNGAMLSNFLEALNKSGGVAPLKRIILVTGAKQYGVHLGAVKNPMIESDPWLTSPERPPNFYYNQQNILHKFCETYNKEWVVTYPNDVIGYAEGNFMNLASAVGIYAAITKELGKDLVFPGAPGFYTKFDCFTSSKLHAEFCVWAALDPRAANQAFNVHNGDTESWQNLWPRLAEHFGLRVKPDQFGDSDHSTLSRAGAQIGKNKGDNSEGLLSQAAAQVGLSGGEGDGTSTRKEVRLNEKPPIADHADTAGLVGLPITAQSKVIQRIDLEQWSQQKDVKEAWYRLAEREGLKKEAFEKATWGFLGFVLGRDYDLVISVSKARKLGYTGYVDTWENLEDVFGELEEAKILPPQRG